MKTARNLRLDLARYYRLPSVQVSLGVVMAFMISAFFIMFAIRPTFATIVSLQKEIEESKKLVSSLEDKVNALNKASTILETIKPSMPLLEKSIPGDGVGYDELAHNLEALAIDTGAHLETLTIGSSLVNSRLVAAYTPSRKEDVINAPITIRLSGTYQSVANFLNRLIGTVRLTSLENIALFRDGASTKNKQKSAELTLTISGSVHYLAEPGAVAKALPSTGGAK